MEGVESGECIFEEEEDKDGGENRKGDAVNTEDAVTI